MTRPFECDSCEARNYAPRLPDAWTCFWRDNFGPEFGLTASNEDGVLGHMCDECTGSREKEDLGVRRVLKRRREERAIAKKARR